MEVNEKNSVESNSSDAPTSVNNASDITPLEPVTHLNAFDSPSAVQATDEPQRPDDIIETLLTAQSNDYHSNSDAADPQSDDSDTDTASETEEEFVDAFDDLHLAPESRPAVSSHDVPTRCAAKRRDRDEYCNGVPFSRSADAGTEEFSMPSEFDLGNDEGNDEVNDDIPGVVKNDVIDEEALIAKEAVLSDEEKEQRRLECRRLKDIGNEQYKQADYVAAVVSYTDALMACLYSHKEDRAVIYANRSAAKMKQENYESALEDCSKAVELNPDYMKALLRRAELYEKTDKLDEALADYQAALERDPSLHQARAACMRLPDQIEQRNEKMKEEMIGKLKDLGNLVLRPFGLSTDNFKLQKDPNSGGYSINFQQNSG